MKLFDNRCECCHKPVNADNSVFIRIVRYDKYGRRINEKVLCTNCWDHTTICIPNQEDSNND